MPVVETHAPGSFCWAELATTDSTSAKSFYGGLFGWGFQDQNMGPDGFYTILTVKNKDAAGMYAMTADQKAQGIPPHWMVYFAVSSADEAVTRAEQAGGKKVAGPFDVHDIGRMAMLEDPTGAGFAVWQPKKHRGAQIVNEIGTPAWPELATRDAKKAEGFYTKLLGWGAKNSNAPMTYTEWQLNGESIGGMIQMDEKWGPAPAHWMIYIMVADCDAVVAKATQLGGKACMALTDIQDVGRFAVLSDPQGATFAVIQLKGMPA